MNCAKRDENCREPPRYIKELYEVTDYEEAKEIAKEVLKETIEKKSKENTNKN